MDTVGLDKGKIAEKTDEKGLDSLDAVSVLVKLRLYLLIRW